MKKLKRFLPRQLKTKTLRVKNRLRLACRLLSKKPRSLPNFIIIGAQKSGTTSLNYCLMQHPRIFRALHKEVHYFDNNNNYEKGTGWYLAHFPLTKEVPRGSITGEATPSYLIYPLAAGRIRELVSRT